MMEKGTGPSRRTTAFSQKLPSIELGSAVMAPQTGQSVDYKEQAADLRCFHGIYLN
jgi:hypothetical protein